MTDQHRGVTGQLSDYLAQVRYDDLPADVIEQAKLVLIGAVGNIIGGCAATHRDRQSALVHGVGGGIPDATVIGTGVQVSLPLAAYGNGVLSTLLDYADGASSDSGRVPIWPGALAVPAALGATEVANGTGADLLTAIVTGYECSARVIASMDASPRQARQVTGSTASTLAAAAAAAKGLGLDADGMISAIGMAGIYTPVPAGYKWMGDAGLRPRKDIKQGWGWMCLAGVFAAVSARHGLQMLQENHLLDGDLGYWRMIGLDVFDPDRITEDLGVRFHIREYHCKPFPGGSVTHSAIAGALELVRRHRIAPEQIASITIGTNVPDSTGLDDVAPARFVDRQFSLQYQVVAALTQGPPGPNWYRERLREEGLHRRLSQMTRIVHDSECQALLEERGVRMALVSIGTTDGAEHRVRIPANPRLRTKEEVAGKFLETVTQVAGTRCAEELLGMLSRVETSASARDVVRAIDQAARAGESQPTGMTRGDQG